MLRSLLLCQSLPRKVASAEAALSRRSLIFRIYRDGGSLRDNKLKGDDHRAGKTLAVSRLPFSTSLPSSILSRGCCPVAPNHPYWPCPPPRVCLVFSERSTLRIGSHDGPPAWPGRKRGNARGCFVQRAGRDIAWRSEATPRLSDGGGAAPSESVVDRRLRNARSTGYENGREV